VSPTNTSQGCRGDDTLPALGFPQPDSLHVFEDNVEQEVQYSSSENAPTSHELGSLTLSRGTEGSGPRKWPAPGFPIAKK